MQFKDHKSIYYMTIYQDCNHILQKVTWGMHLIDLGLGRWLNYLFYLDIEQDSGKNRLCCSCWLVLEANCISNLTEVYKPTKDTCPDCSSYYPIVYLSPHRLKHLPQFDTSRAR